MTSHLLVRPIQIVGESSAGILMRAVEKNGFPSLQSLVWAYWKNPGGRSWAMAACSDPKRYDEIVRTLGIKVPLDLSPVSLRVGPTSKCARLFDGMVIPEVLFREDGRYYCPECLQQKAFWRRNWTLKPFSVCLEHKKYLLRDCAVCGKPLHPWRGKLDRCECGADLSAMESHPADPSALIWWLDCHKQAGRKAQVVDEALVAIEAIDGRGDLPQEEHKRLGLVYEWIENGVVQPSLLESIAEHSKEIHPRLLMLPLLRSRYAELRQLGQTILGLWKPRIPQAILITDRQLQSGDAELALGVSRFQFMKFLEMGLVNFPSGKRANGRDVSFDAVNRILFFLQRTERGTAKGSGRGQTESTAKMVLDVMSCVRTSAGYDVCEGLNSLRVLVGEASRNKVKIDSSWLDIKEMSSLLGTYSEAVRFLVNKGHIKVVDRNLRGGKKRVASRAAVEDFNRQFIFAGVLAKELNVNPTNLAEKLMALGAPPVSGPRVDGALVYLFRRADVEGVDVEKLRALGSYETRAGRKPKSDSSKSGRGVAKPDESDTMTISRAAACLGLKHQEVEVLVRKGMIKRVRRLERAVRVTRRSVEGLRKKLKRRDMISVGQAAAQFHQPSTTFERLWIKTGILRVHDWGLWRRISTRDLAHLQSQLDGRLTASEGGRLFSMHRSYLPNLERRGAIKPVMLGSKRKVRLYNREDLHKL